MYVEIREWKRWLAEAGSVQCLKKIAMRLVASRHTGLRGRAPTKKRSRACQEHLWEDLFLNPSSWWDNRPDKATQHHPDFTHKASREPLWLNSLHKPSWVEARLDSLCPHPLSVGIIHQIRILCEEGNLDMALDDLSRMDQQGIVPSERVYVSLLKACNRQKSLDHVVRVQEHLVRHRLDMTSFIGDYLVVTLASCGAVEDACHAFYKLHDRTVFSWTAIISAYSNCGRGQEALEMSRHMRSEGIQPDKFTFASMLKACSSISDLEGGRKVHTEVEMSGFASDVYVGSSLLSLYGKCGCILEAEFVFSGLRERNIVSWNAMLSTYVEHRQGEMALQLYRQMQVEIIKADQRTFVISLQACCILARKEVGVLADKSGASLPSEIGRAFHADWLKQGFMSDVYIDNTLISFYSKCGSIREAENVFCGMSERNTVSWNEMLSVYIEQGEGEKALQLYRLIQADNVCLDQWTIVLAFQACCMLAEKEVSTSILDPSTEKWLSLEIGEALHADAEARNLTSHVFVGNSIVNMYGKCRRVTEAENVFQKLSERDIVSWNAMLSTYVEQAGYQEEALDLYMQMEARGIEPDDISLVCILRACSERGSSEICKVIHFIVLSFGCDGSPLLTNTLVHAYGSCASMVDAQAVFDRLSKRDTVSWNALIASYALNGSCKATLQKFQQMLDGGTKPDGITFVSVFFACSHAGFVDKAVEYLESMCNYGIAVERKHFGSIVDLLGRAGDFKNLESVMRRMPTQPDAILWSCFLGACQMHNNMKLARQAFDYAVLEQPKEANPYVMMANICAKDGLYNC